MNLIKDGITIEVVHPSDIAFYKKAGYVEVKPAESDPAQPVASAKKGSKKQASEPVEKELTDDA